jgi:hypothetical protein
MIDQFLHSLMPSEKAYLDRLQNKTATWIPQSKPQWEACLTRADETFYGGAAGGGKSDLLLGLAVELHHNSAIFRRTYPNIKGLLRRARDIIGDRAKEQKQDKTWTFPDGRTLEFGSVQYEDDKTDWQGRPHDLKGFDEITEFTESQYIFITGWTRTTIKGQRTRILATGNPPTDESGSWIIKRWGAWLDETHPNPAESGELRWYAMVDGEEVERENGKPFEHGGETIQPRSRTFIRALLEDNPFLSEDGAYKSVLQSLPEPLRSQMLKGDFGASAEIDPFQVIPTAWVRAAQRRWIEREKPDVPMTSAGIDPARGGRDKMAVARMYDNWVDELDSWTGSVVKDGAIAAELIRQKIGDPNEICNAPIGIDVVGIGSSAYDHLKVMYKKVVPINAAEGSKYRDKSKLLKMRNTRAEYYWRARDALDPETGDNIALPPGNNIVADLCAARYKVSAAGVTIESKDEIKKRLGRSPDEGESILLAIQAQADDNWYFI